MSKSMLCELSDEILLKQGNNLRFKARGSSMRPFIRDGDFVEIKPIDNFREIDSGDILFFKKQGTLCLHRLLRTENGKFVVKGDSNREIDGAICEENIIGKLISVERSGHLISFKSGWFNKLSPFSWIWYRFVCSAKELAKPTLKSLYNLFLSVSSVRLFLKVNEIKSPIEFNLKELISEKVKQLPDNIIKSQSLGPFLYGTGASKKEIYRNSYAAILAMNELLKQKEHEVLKSLHDNGIEVISLKGTKQIEELYGDLGLRPTTDIDLLIRNTDKEKAICILSDIGFALDISENETSNNLKSQLTFTSNNRVMVDLHWDLLESERYKGIIKADTKDIWKIIGEQKPGLMKPEDQLIFLVFHLSVPHFYSRLYWLIDIALLMNKHGRDMDFSYITQLSKKWRIQQALLLTMALCQDIFKLDVTHFEGELTALKFRTMLLKKILKKNLLSTDPAVWESKKYIYGLLVRDSFMDIVRVLIGALFPPAQWIKEKYNIKNGHLVGFYRFIHPAYSLLVGIFGYPAIRKKERV
jgi:hypothetical protein